MSDVLRVHHAGLTVTDLDRSVAFYRDVLGCRVVMEQEKEGGYLADIVGYPGASVRMAHLRPAGGDLVIELFEYRQPRTKSGQLEPARVGNAHLCFLVSDLDSTYERIVALGIDFFSPPIAIDTGANTGGKGLYLRDPDGITIELFQAAPRS